MAASRTWTWLLRFAVGYEEASWLDKNKSNQLFFQDLQTSISDFSRQFRLI